MHLSTRNDVRSPPSSGDRNTLRVAKPSGARPAEPLTSGYGVVIEKEEELAAANRGYLGDVHGAHGADLWRILREHQILLEANRALLRKRCEGLPHAERFSALYHEDPDWSPAHGSAALVDLPSLPDLVARHTSLIGDMDALVARAARGEHDEPILAEIERNHEEMAWMLMALMKEGEVARDSDSGADSERLRLPRRGEESWDNEGGGPRA